MGLVGNIFPCSTTLCALFNPHFVVKHFNHRGGKVLSAFHINWGGGGELFYFVKCIPAPYPAIIEKRIFFPHNRAFLANTVLFCPVSPYCGYSQSAGVLEYCIFSPAGIFYPLGHFLSPQVFFIPLGIFYPHLIGGGGSNTKIPGSVLNGGTPVNCGI